MNEPPANACPFCGSRKVRRPAFTWWGGVLGPLLLGIVRCDACKSSFRRNSTHPATLAKSLYALCTLLLAVAIGYCLFLYISGRW